MCIVWALSVSAGWSDVGRQSPGSLTQRDWFGEAGRWNTAPQRIQWRAWPLHQSADISARRGNSSVCTWNTNSRDCTRTWAGSSEKLILWWTFLRSWWRAWLVLTRGVEVCLLFQMTLIKALTCSKQNNCRTSRSFHYYFKVGTFETLIVVIKLERCIMYNRFVILTIHHHHKPSDSI